VLSRLDGTALDLERTLAETGVVDGELLYLRRVEEAAGPAVVEDFVDAVAAVVEASPGRWRPVHVRLLLLGLAAAAWAVGAVALLPLDSTEAAARASVGLGTAGGLVLAGTLLARLLRRPGAGSALTLAALPWWAVGSAHLAMLLPATDGFALAAAGITGVAVGATAAAVATPPVRVPSAAVTLAAVLLAGATAAVGLLGFTTTQAAAVLAVLTIVLGAQLPGWAVGAAGLIGFDESEAPTRLESVGGQVASGRELLGWLLAGTCVAGAVGLSALALDGLAARSLCVAAVLAFALRARHHRFLGEVLPLAGAAAVGGMTLEAALAWSGGVGVEVAALAAGVALLAVALLLGEGNLSPQVRRWFGHAELAANMALTPLALWAVGAFAVLASWAHRL
jgi:type VII secretion integral membrane protein EccD